MSDKWQAIDPTKLSVCGGTSVEAPSRCYDLEDLVKINNRDGQSKNITKTYTLPRNLLMWHSSYFAAAFDPTNSAAFTDVTKNGLTLEEDPDVLEAFCCWLFTGRLKDLVVNASPEEQYLESATLCKIWVFADMRGIPALGNVAIDMLHERISASWTVVPYSALTCAYETTPPSSLLSKFFVDAYTRLYSYQKFQERAVSDKIASEFLIDAMTILVRQGEHYGGMMRPSWTLMNRCLWHDHSGPGGKSRLELRK